MITQSVSNGINRKVKSTVALYGKVRMLRGYCKKCDGFAFMDKEGTLACCESKADRPTRVRRMSPMTGRKQPPPIIKQALLTSQNNSCFYCSRPFGTPVLRRRKLIFLRCEWDHKIPVSLWGSNESENFVAACQLCNSFKGDKVFETPENAIEFLKIKWSSRLREE